MWNSAYWNKTYWNGFYWLPPIGAIIIEVSKQKIRGFTRNVGRLMNP